MRSRCGDPGATLKIEVFAGLASNLLILNRRNDRIIEPPCIGKLSMISNRWFLVLACCMTLAHPAPSKEDQSEPSPPPIKFTHEFLCPGEISPLQYGQFVEYL